MTYSTFPPGVSKFTTSPTFFPSNAPPSGDLCEILFCDISASSAPTISNVFSSLLPFFCTTTVAPTSTLSVIGNAHFFTVATTSEGVWIGTAGTAAVNLSGVDIFLQGDAEFDGAVTLGDATGDTITINGHIANATTTGNFVVGSSSWAAPTSTLSVVGSAHFFNVATSSSAFWVGSGGVANDVDLDGGDLYVQGGAEIDGSIWTGAATFSGAATTTGKAVFASTAPSATATSTVTFGSYGTADTKGLCLKFFSGGVTIWCYFDTARLAGGAATSTAFVCDSDSSCETN